MQIFISFVVEIFNIIKSNSTGTKNIPQFHFTILNSPDQRVKDRGGSLYLADLCLEVVQPAGVYLNWSPKAPHQYKQRKKFKTRKIKNYLALRQKIFRRKISFRGPNVRYKTPLHPRLHPVTPFQSKQV